jgi:hypothetical protein
MNGQIWSVGMAAEGAGFGLARWNGSTWLKVPGGLAHLAVDANGSLWGVTNNFTIFFSAKGDGSDWKLLPGAGRDIKVGADNTVWIVGTIWEMGGYGIYKWNGGGWTKVPGGLVGLGVDAKGSIWGIQDTGAIFRSARGTGADWVQIPGCAKNINVGADGSVWIVGCTAELGGFGLYKLNGSTWDKVPAGVIRVAVDARGRPWVINNIDNAGTLYSGDGSHSEVVPATWSRRLNVLNPSWYLDANPDLKAAFGNNVYKAQQHWLSYGVSEGRDSAANFSVKSYLARNGFIKAAWGDRYDAAIDGYINTGQREGLDPSPAVGATNAKIGSVDAVDYIGSKLPSVKPLIEAHRGTFLVEEAESRSSEDRTQLFKIKGKFDWARVGALNNPSSNRLNNPFKDLASGFSNVAMVRNQSATLTDPTGGMAILTRNAAALAAKLGAPNPVPLEVALFDKNNELDLEIAFKIADGWRVTGEIVPIARTQVALKTLTLKLHAKINKITRQRSFSAEAEGRLFAKPTSFDPWLGVTPVVEIDNEGGITFGGDFTGACPGDPTPDTEPNSCQGPWDVMRLGQIRSTGGVLKVTVKGGVVDGVEAALKDGRLGSNNVQVDGAILVDADVSPGAGLVLKTRGTPGLKDTLVIYRLMTGNIEPFKSLFAGIDKLPNPNIPVSQDSYIVIAPTGLTVGHIDIPDPTIRVNINAAAPGVNIRINSDFKGDVEKIMKGDLNGMPNGYLQADANFDAINHAVKGGASAIPGIGVVVSKALEVFSFNGVSARVDVKNSTRSSQANANFTLFSQAQSVSVPMEVAMDPSQLPAAVLKGITSLVTSMPPWLKDGIAKLPGGQQIVDGLQYVGGQVKGFLEKVRDVASATCAAGYTKTGLQCDRTCPAGSRNTPGICDFGFGSAWGCPAPLRGLKPACINPDSNNSKALIWP